MATNANSTNADFTEYTIKIAQVEQAQDKKKFVVKVMSSFFINQILPQ
jgi:hypothetical protein